MSQVVRAIRARPHTCPVLHRGNLRRVVGASAVVLLLAALMAFYVADRAGAGATRCQQHRDRRARARRASSPARATAHAGHRRLVVGRPRPGRPRPVVGLASSPGEVHVAGFSGSGFSARASTCGRVSFHDRAPTALGVRPALVVVEGGLNDYDQPAAAIDRGFRDLMADLAGQRVVVVGPADAPARAGAVPRVDALLDVAERAVRRPVRPDQRPRPRLPRRPAAPHRGRPPRSSAGRVAERIAAVSPRPTRRTHALRPLPRNGIPRRTDYRTDGRIRRSGRAGSRVARTCRSKGRLTRPAPIASLCSGPRHPIHPRALGHRTHDWNTPSEDISTGRTGRYRSDSRRCVVPGTDRHPGRRRPLCGQPPPRGPAGRQRLGEGPRKRARARIAGRLRPHRHLRR